MSKLSTIKQKIKTHKSAIAVGAFGIVAVIFTAKRTNDNTEINGVTHFPDQNEFGIDLSNGRSFLIGCTTC